MLVSGVVLLLFIVFHILDLTVGARPCGQRLFVGAHRPSMPTTTWSPASNAPRWRSSTAWRWRVLGAHLVHGLWTAVQDLGRHRAPHPAGLRRGRRAAGVGGHGGQHDDSARRVDGTGADDRSDHLRGVGAPVDGGVPDGDPATAWERRMLEYRLVSPLNRRKFTVIVVGTGLAGAGCAAALGELGYHVECFTFHDAPAARAQRRGAGRHQRRARPQGRQRQRRPVRARTPSRAATSAAARPTVSGSARNPSG